MNKLINRIRNFLSLRFNVYKGVYLMYRAIAASTPRGALRFEISLAEHCNLNCAGCAHFSPLAPSEFADFEEVSRDFARLSELLHGRVENIHLLGGEPLLHPDLIKFLKAARDNFPTACIELVTNGLKLPQQHEEFWLACRENRIIIRPTKYPIKLDYEKIEELAHKYQVKLKYFGGDKVTKTFFKWGLDIDGGQNSSLNFLRCKNANTCIQLSHGRLYTCNIAAKVHHFNQYFGMNLELCPEDSIDIYKAASGEEILAFLARPIPFCRYCNGIVDEYVPWHQSSRDISEWV